MRATCELFSREYANLPTGNSERPVHNIPENQILTFLWRIGDQEQVRTVADHFASSSAVSTRKVRRHILAFHDLRYWGRFIPGRNANWNRKFPEFPEKRTTSRGGPKFSKRISGNFLFHSILNRNFRKFWSNGTRPTISKRIFWKIAVPFDFQPKK